MNFIDAAIISSDLYKNFLTVKKLGTVEYRIRSFNFDDYYFYLEPHSFLKYPDTLQMRINAIEFSNEAIKIVSYDKDKNILKISADTKAQKYILNAKPQEVILFSDLKFLIENVAKFYKKHGNKVSFPKSINSITYYEDENLTDILSEEQHTAIIGALSNPLSYVWGAPGTGKTNFVLARCVLSYLKNAPKAKILITAPTNNAVEQTLFGVLPVLKSCGIDLNKVFRLGSPSAKFYNMYPECCEYGKAELKAKMLKEERDKKSKERKLYSQYESFLTSKQHLNDFETESKPLFDALYKEKAEYENYKNQKPVVLGKKLLLENDIKKLEKDKKSISNEIEKYKQYINKNSCGFRQFLFHRKIEYYYELLRQSLKEFEETEKKINQHKNSLSMSATALIELNFWIDRHEALFEYNKNQLLNISDFWIKLYNLVETISINNYNEVLNEINNKISESHKIFNDKEILFADINELSLIEVKSKIDKLTFEICNLTEEYDLTLEQTSSQRIADCSVLAATIDTCIQRVSPDDEFIPAHIFLDEAGYCPLVKGAALLAYSCPLTMLGDHMQLPPICAMNDKEFRYENNKLIALYAQSALYIEDITEEPFSIADNYLEHNQPKFKQLTKYNLNYTYRFGEKLAEILANNVYTPDFHGTDKHITEVYYINSPKLDPQIPRYSSTEITAIVKYISQHNQENISVLTPYKYQKNELQKALAKLNCEVLTVHGSQGREWNTVILSVVDTTNKWFTNSNSQESNGKNVINTAVSRAKKKLIIVCDVNHWSKQNKQLIGKLLQIAKELPEEQL